MKTLILLIFLFFLPLATSVYGQKIVPEKEYKFVGTYNGINQDVEFEFIADNGKTYVFQEIGDEVTVDLYEEVNFDKKFEVTWINQAKEILDDEGESTGETIEIKLIIWIKTL